MRVCALSLPLFIYQTGSSWPRKNRSLGGASNCARQQRNHCPGLASTCMKSVVLEQSCYCTSKSIHMYVNDPWPFLGRGWYSFPGGYAFANSPKGP